MASGSPFSAPMLAAEIGCVPVEDEDGNLRGILRYFDLLKLLLPADTERLSVRNTHVWLAKPGEGVVMKFRGWA